MRYDVQMTIRNLIAAIGILVLTGCSSPGNVRPPETVPPLIAKGVNESGAEVFLRTRDQARVVRIPSGEFALKKYVPTATPEPAHELVYLPAYLIDETAEVRSATSLSWIFDPAYTRQAAVQSCPAL